MRKIRQCLNDEEGQRFLCDYLKEKITIGITTKDRVREVRETLLILAGSELRHCKIIVIDDGSGGEFISEDEYELDLTIIRYAMSKRQMARRNEICKLCNTEFYLSLDDDSAPLHGSMVNIISKFDDDPRIATVAFTITENSDFEFEPGCDFDCRSFVACGNMHRVDIFNSLGGYLTNLQYGYEETAYAFMLYAAGYKIVHTSDLVVYHRFSPINRTFGFNKHSLYSQGYVEATYLPPAAFVTELLKVIKNYFRIKTLFQALCYYFYGASSVKKREVITYSTYRKWVKLQGPSIS